MVEIKDIIKSKKAVLCFLAFLLILAGISFDFFSSEERISPAPSHIVLSKWYGENGRRSALDEIESETLVKTAVLTIPCAQTQFVIKTDNLRFSLFTNGKIIYKNTDKKLSGYGKHIHIIDISDIKEGAELYLFLSPVKGENSKIEGDILLTSKNDLILNLLNQNKSVIAVLCAFILVVIALLILGIIRLLKKKKTAPRALFLSGCFAVLFTVLLMKNDVSQLFFCSDFSRYLTLYSAYSLLGVFISSFLCSALKLKSKAVNIINALITLYTLFRAVLFFAILLPLSDFIFISHLLLIISLVLPVILKLFRRSGRVFLY